MSDFSPETIGGLLTGSTARWPELTAAEEGSVRLTYEQLDRLTDDLARMFLKRGIVRGQHVCIWCANTINDLAALMALQKLGVVSVLVNGELTASELSALLRLSDAEVLLCGDGFRGNAFRDACPVLRDAGLIRDHIYIGGDVTALAKGAELASEADYAAARAAVRPEDTATMLFTSGTSSGRPRAVMTSHRSWVLNSASQAAALLADSSDRFYVAVPMFHCFGLCSCVLAALSVGARLCFPPDKSSRTTLEQIQERGITVLHGVPTMYHAILAKDRLESYDISSLRIGMIGGDTYTVTQFMEIRDKLDFNLVPGLGLTEATGGITFACPDDDVSVLSTTVGHFSELLEGRVIERETGRVLPLGEIGEICVRGPSVMQGYYKDPESTARVLEKDGWLHTGDLGYLDEQGNLHFAGRLKEVIIRGGENISPGEVENCIAEYPKVDEIKVVGVPSRHFGEEVCACVTLRPGETADSGEIIDYVRARLAKFKVPKFVLFFPELPKTNRGKYDCIKLRSMAAEQVRKK